MSAARQAFLTRVKALKVALGEPALISRSPTEVDHNSTATLLRNGVAVVAFALLEDFIRSRLGEVLSRIANTHLPFDELPSALREAALIGAARALSYHGDLKRRQGEDYISFIQTHAGMIGSTATASYDISSIALGWDRPNLTDADVKDILRAFKVQDGWGNIDRLAARVGVSSPSLKEAFRQAASRRHRAAHSAEADTEITHLISFAPQAIGIALGFDALISSGLRRLIDHDPMFLSDDGSVQQNDITIRFLDPAGGSSWRELKEGKKRAVASAMDLAALTAACLARPAARHDIVVVRDRSFQPTNWYIQSVA